LSPASASRRPVEFDAQEAALWNDVVRSMRRDWLTPTVSVLLRSFVELAINCQWAAGEVRRLPLGSREQGRAIARQVRLCKSLTSLARTLRLTPKANRPNIRSELSDVPTQWPWDIA
jgi:hypothetical protein